MANKKRRKRKKINYRKQTTIMQRNLRFSFAFIALGLIVLSFRIISINSKSGENYAKSVLENHGYQTQTIPYVRGEILDRNNLVLAYSPKVYNLIVDAYLINHDDGKYYNDTMDALRKCFELDMEALGKYIKENPNSRYYRAKVGLKPDEIEEFQGILADKKKYPKVIGVWFEVDYEREYPFGHLACDTIGFATKAGEGQLGLELYYDKILSGTNGVVSGYMNEDLSYQNNTIDAIDGNTIVTTLDYYIQSVAEKYVKQYNEETGSKSTGVVVQNPKTGEILALVDYPSFDLNKPRDLTPFFTKEEIEGMTEKEQKENLFKIWKNNCVSFIYEPGSVIKPLTVASGLDEGTLKNEDKFLCDGYEPVGGYNIHCDRTWGHGELTLEQSIMFSCNDALMQIAAKEGVAQLSKYQSVFGFGQKTGIDLPGEEVGLIYLPDKMTDVDLYTNSFGQNMNVTMVQMSSSFCSLINGGIYYKPYLLKSVLNSEGKLITETKPEVLRKTISKDTSKILRGYLYNTVEGGSGNMAAVEGYEIGGKTGTAEKYPREDKKFLLSFIGFAPLDDPEVVVYVIVDEPGDPDSAHSPSAKVIFKNIMTEILPYLNVEKKQS